MHKLFITLATALAALPLAAQAPTALNGDNWKPLSGEWKVEGEAASVSVGKDESVALALQGATLNDFEITYEFQASGVYAGLCFRTHQSEAFAKAEADTDLGTPGLYGNAVCFSASQGFRLLSNNGDKENVLGHVGVEDMGKDDWRHVRIEARGGRVHVQLDDASFEADDETFIGGGLAFCVAADGKDGGKAAFRNLKVNDLGRTQEWRALFNGKDTTGWKEWGSEKWSVEDGVIYGRSGEKKSEGYLATEERFKDFRVRGRFQMLGEGNFGLFFHSTITPKEDGYPVIAGVQGEVEPALPSSTGWAYESYKRGWLVEPPKNTLAAYVLDPTGWNEIEIRSVGNVITTWVNGVRALQFDDPKPNLTEGSFALQLHAGGVDGIAWKDLYVTQP